MGEIITTKIVEAYGTRDFQEELSAAIEELQSAKLEVEVKHSMAPAVRGVGYMYSAIVIGRQK